MCGGELLVLLSNGRVAEKEYAGKGCSSRPVNRSRRRELVAGRSLGQGHEPVRFNPVEEVSRVVRHVKARVQGCGFKSMSVAKTNRILVEARCNGFLLNC